MKQRKNKKTIDVKEIKLRPNIDEHDYQVKLRKIFEFLDSGDKVKVTMRYRGREMAHQQIGIDVLGRVKTDTEEKSKIELEPKLEGRQMIMVLAPGK
jgi:translation initiation factor IF-3